MRLFIAEKPSLGRALVDVLPKPHQKSDGFIKAANGDVVTWCIGHLLEQAEPEAYNPDYKKWAVEHLPIVPTEWKLVVKANTKKQFTVVKKLIKQADVLVNMGDPDRVGQILIDEVINHCGVSKSQKAQVLRCLISDLNPAAVTKSLNNLRKNTDFIPLATSALARARADWLYGINMTRLCTLQGRQSGYNGVLSIGRVQTPVLGLVVHRDLEIANFVSKPFYEVVCRFKTRNGEFYQAKWRPSKACEPYMDEDNRVLSKALALNVISRVAGQEGKIVKVSQDIKATPAPLPYSLSALQIDAAKRFGMSAQTVLDTCQQLYERHKLVTYPRSDCRYLPKEHLNDVPQVIAAIRHSCSALNDAANNANASLISKAWNDSKVSAHHAIIPTSKSTDMSRLSAAENNIYELVARQYLIQFYPPFEYVDKQIDTEVSGGLFIAKQKEVVSLGWKSLFPSKPNTKAEDDFSATSLPNVEKGDDVDCLQAELKEKQTTPPKYFTDATLLAAMTGIARYVTDASIKKVLRDTDGLGTEATRAGIIELLFKRQFLTRKGKDIRATDVGTQLICALPERMTIPDMTAHWESQLEAISQKEIKYTHFMDPITQSINELINEVKAVTFGGLKGKGTPYKPKGAYKAKGKRSRKVKA
ncbi:MULTISPECIES: DNA topoisomerase III [Pseudomonadati]|uniref:DNA topoisomerase 3 n=1 Tax=Shewanella aestuarii TaxID=1028752 RepID=A0ABT0KWW4_9GAMM|nr:DNA topoisomerase III [Shewanella aestuarii]MCL1115735.1 DNA topoisomerase III [Shewanella aestuarii]GGN68492.1 DNA topoisomerase 3 [Shewanella aestuarii]